MAVALNHRHKVCGGRETEPNERLRTRLRNSKDLGVELLQI